MHRKIIPYDPKLKEFARNLRNNSTHSEIALWKRLRQKQMRGYDFHRQKPIDRFIVDFFCHELMLCIELDGYSHQLDEVAIKDEIKEAKLISFGLTVLRFTDKQVFAEMDNVLRTIEAHIDIFEEHTPNPSQEGRKHTPDPSQEGNMQ
jgi:very-short-patch-repair endonuclease